MAYVSEYYFFFANFSIKFYASLLIFFIVKHSCSIVTIYATLGDEGIIHGFNETEVSTVITSHELMPKLKLILDKLPKVTTIVYFEDQLVKTDLKGFERIRTFSYSDVIQYGIKNPVGKFSTSLICYPD